MGIPDKLLDGIDRLEPLPITVQKLLVALNGNDVDFNEIAGTIEYDGAITSNILRTANSAAFGGRSRIEHVRDAVVRLGTITLLDILLMSHLRTMHKTSSVYRASEDDLWLHGATASLAIKALVKETRNRRIPEAATIAALIHDIGKLVMLRHMRGEMDDILKKCRENRNSSFEAERELMGCDHAEVGAAMARKWNFPEPITMAIEHHHEAPTAEADPMLDAVILSNLTAKSVVAGPDNEGAYAAPIFAGSDVRLGLAPDAFLRLCAQTAEWLEDLKRSYNSHN